ncbi:phage tail protein [Marinimicrobium sp. ARAG 43.8]|uniref:phage tail protein n=1 Tax=Marinimicrobium sp. ARAG 43.8 TaxID=3418719 RepID=UPI003CEF0CDC
MSDPFISQVTMYGFDWPPTNWALCNGQVININQNQALFALLGITYGGNGSTNFQLPNLQARTPVHRGVLFGALYQAGSSGGAEQVTLNSLQMPQHSHPVHATNSAGNQASYEDTFLAAGFDARTQADADIYSNANALEAQATTMVTASGGNQPHTNLQPSLVVSFCMALFGVFPSRN